MNLPDRLHCPDCQGRLAFASARELRCSGCGRTIPADDGIIDFVNDLPPSHPGADRYRGVTQEYGLLAFNLPARIMTAAGGRWPTALGDVIEFGCGRGLISHAILSAEIVRGMLVLDTDRDMLQACQARVAALDVELGGSRLVLFAALAGGQNVLRDTVADTVIGSVLLSGIGDVRAFLSMVHRVLKPGGRAAFVVPNRRYYQAICLAMAEALTQRFARDGAWPEGCVSVLNLLSQVRRLLVHRDDQAFLSALEEKHLFDSDALENLGKEIGFVTAEAIPLDPDPAGGETMTRLCLDAGAPDAFARAFGSVAATVGRPFLSLLSHQDSSAYSLLWLTKASAPAVRIYTGRPAGPPVGYVGPEAALGGAPPRWSVELLGRDTPAGVVLKVGGWCLSNIDALCVRVTLDGAAQDTPVWRHRPDVHEVLNREHIYHPLNALCSGIEAELMFAGVHPDGTGCPLRVDMLLAGGLMITGPAPERLTMDQSMVVAH